MPEKILSAPRPKATHETSRIRSDIHDRLENLTHVVDSVASTPFPPLQITTGEQLAWEQIIAQLDASYKQNRAALLFHRNQIAPINRLPDEILRMIFLHAGREHPRWKMTQYMYLSFVCRRWRSLAIDTVGLWSLIELGCHNFPLVFEFLSRTKESKITVIQGEPNNSRWRDASIQVDMLEQLIAPRLHLVGSLSLSLSSPRWKEILPMLQQPAPNLRQLHLIKSGNETIPFSTLYDDPPNRVYSKLVNLPGLFRGVAPLRSLVFEMPQMLPWNSLIPLVHGLRDLKLVIPRWDIDTHRPAIEQLLRFLEACPSLETLDLSTTYGSSFGLFSTAVSHKCVVMKHLSRVVLYHTEDASDLLKHLVTPQLRELSLSLDTPVPETLFDAIASCYDLTTLKYLRLEGGRDDRSISKIQGSTSIPATRNGAGVDMPFSISYGIGETSVATSLFHAIIARSSNLAELHIDNYFLRSSYGHADPLCYILKPAGNLRTLSLSPYADSKGILRALGEDKTLCPKLEYLVLCCQDPSRLAKDVLVCVNSRKEVLKKLRIEGIRALGIYKEQLEDLVDLDMVTHPSYWPSCY